MADKRTNKGKLTITDLLPLLPEARSSIEIVKFAETHLREITDDLPKDECTLYYSKEQAEAIYRDAESLGLDVSKFKDLVIENNYRKMDYITTYKKAFKSAYQSIEKGTSAETKPATKKQSAQKTASPGTAPAPSPAPAPTDEIPSEDDLLDAMLQEELQREVEQEQASTDISNFCDRRPSTNKPLPDEIPTDQIVEHVPTKYELTPAWERDPASLEYVRQTRLLPAVDTFASDTGNAQAFRDETKGWLLYDCNPNTPDKKRWYAWNGTAWVQDAPRVMQSALIVARTLQTELGRFAGMIKGGDGALLKPYATFYKHVQASQNRPAIRHMIETAKELPGMYADFTKEWYKGRYLISVKNGIFDMQANKFYYVDKDAEKIQELRDTCLPTRYVDITYNPTADAPMFLDYISKIHTDNRTPGLSAEEIQRRHDEAVPVHKRIFGYRLYPKNIEKIGTWNFGRRKDTAKSTEGDFLVRTYPTVFTMASSSELYSAQRTHPTIKNALSYLGVFFQETETNDENPKVIQQDVVAPSIYKALVDNTDTMEFRANMQNPETPSPICCLPTMSTNKPPRFDNGVDIAIKERVCVIPHNHVFAGVEKDTQFVDKLIAKERDAIFSCMINWCMEYITDLQSKGTGLLPMPDYWRQAREDALISGAYGCFLTDRYIRADPDCDPVNMKYKDALEQEFIDWARVNNRIDEVSLTQKHVRIPTTNQQGEELIDDWGNVVYKAEYDKELLSKASRKKLEDALLVCFNTQYIDTNHSKQHVYLIPKKSSQMEQYEQQTAETKNTSL